MKKDQVNILWTNDNPITAELMVFMYARHAKVNNRFADVRVIIWGATTKLTAEDANIQSIIKELQELGVEFSACITCAEKLGVADIIQGLGIETIKWGGPLSEILKNGEHLLTI